MGKFILIALMFLLSCNAEENNQREIFRRILQNQQQSAYNKQIFEKSKKVLLNRYLNNGHLNKIYNILDIHLHNEGVFYNKTKDSLHFVYTIEMALKNNVTIPDSLIAFKNEKGLHSFEFSGVIKDDSIIYYPDCGNGLLLKKGLRNKHLYTNTYKKEVIEKFIDLIFEQNDVQYYNCKEDSSDIPYYPFNMLWNLYNDYIEKN